MNLFRKIAILAVGSSLIGSMSPAVAETYDTQAVSECPSGYFCVWSGTNFTGTVRKYSSTNAYLKIDIRYTQSYYNRRAKRTWLHEDANGNGQSACINPGASSGNTSGWRESAEAVYNSSIEQC